jgi:hypothetical protein
MRTEMCGHSGAIAERQTPGRHFNLSMPSPRTCTLLAHVQKLKEHVWRTQGPLWSATYKGFKCCLYFPYLSRRQ